MLPESWFSINEKNSFREHVCGNFHVKQLRESARKYYIANDFAKAGITPCQALEELVNSEGEMYVSQ